MDYFSRASRPSISSRPAHLEQLFRPRASISLARPTTPTEAQGDCGTSFDSSTPSSQRSSASWKSSTMDMHRTPPQTPNSDLSSGPPTPNDDFISFRSLKFHLSPRLKRMGSMLRRRTCPQVMETTATDFSNWCLAAAETEARRSHVRSLTQQSTSLDEMIEEQPESELECEAEASKGIIIEEQQLETPLPSLMSPPPLIDSISPRTSLDIFIKPPPPPPPPQLRLQISLPSVAPRRNSQLYVARPLPAVPPCAPVPSPTRSLPPLRCYYFLARNCDGYVNHGRHGEACEGCMVG